MKRCLILMWLALPASALAQTDPILPDPTPPDAGEGLGLIERGLGIIAENLRNDFGPELDRLAQDMGIALSDMAPMLRDLSALVDDLAHYEMPERLENGDVLIRRKADAPPPPPLENLPGGGNGDIPGRPPVPIDPHQPEIPL